MSDWRGRRKRRRLSINLVCGLCPPGEDYTQYSLHNVHLQYPWVRELTTHPHILEVIKAVLGPDVILLDSRFICKYPAVRAEGGAGEEPLPYVAWHQDMRWTGHFLEQRWEPPLTFT